MRTRLAAAIGLVLLAGSAVGVHAQDEDASATQGMPESSDTTPVRWSSSRFPAPRGARADIRDVAAGPKGTVAVGQMCTKRFRCTATAWWSRNGRSWRRIDVDRPQRAAGDSVESAIDAVAWGPRGYVAVGWSRPPMPAELAAFATEGPGPIAAVWRSRDGKRWRRVGTDSPFSPNPTPGDITASGGRYLVLSSGRSMVVTSRDGERWRKWRAGISRQGGWISRVESLGDGYAAVGSVRTEDADGRRSCCSTAVWESPNGRRWKPWIVAGDDSYLGRIAVLGDRVAVVEGGRMADEFTRPRGGFTRVLDTDGSVEMGFVPDAAGLYGVGVAGGRFIAAGQACEPALWTSKDGLDWTRLAWSGRLPRGADRWYDVHFAADDRRVVIAGSAEVPREERSGRPPKLVDFALSAPLSALDASENDSRDAGSTCVPPPRMPTAQLATEGGQLVTGALVESCWLPPGSEPAARMDCQESEKPTVDDLPMVPVGKGSTQLRLSLADGSPLAAVSVLQHHARGADVTSAERLVDTGTCSPLEDVPFDVEANRVLIVSVTFDCGQGGATYLFRTRAQTVAE